MFSLHQLIYLIILFIKILRYDYKKKPVVHENLIFNVNMHQNKIYLRKYWFFNISILILSHAELKKSYYVTLFESYLHIFFSIF